MLSRLSSRTRFVRLPKAISNRCIASISILKHDQNPPIKTIDSEETALLLNTNIRFPYVRVLRFRNIKDSYPLTDRCIGLKQFPNVKELFFEQCSQTFIYHRLTQDVFKAEITCIQPHWNTTKLSYQIDSGLERLLQFRVQSEPYGKRFYVGLKPVVSPFYYYSSRQDYRARWALAYVKHYDYAFNGGIPFYVLKNLMGEAHAYAYLQWTKEKRNGAIWSWKYHTVKHHLVDVKRYLEEYTNRRIMT
jgi:hypothetical protein